MAGSPFAHFGEHGLYHRNGAEHVGIELTLQVSERRLLEHAFVTVARIVHEDIDGTNLAGRLCNSVGNCAEVSDVKQDRVSASLCETSEGRRCLVGAYRTDDLMSCLQGALGKCPP